MDEQNAPRPAPSETAGQQFVKRIRPAGCVLFIALAILVTAICLTSGRDPITGYKAPQTTEYYAAHPDELAAELEANVFPALLAYTLSAEAGEDGVTVTVGGNLAAARSAILRYFDQSLLIFQRAASD